MDSINKNRIKASIIKFAGISILFYIFIKIINIVFGTVCTFKLFLGLPCPFCGITRAAVLLLQFRIRESFNMHPLLFLVIIGIIFYFILKYKNSRSMKLLWIYVIFCFVIFIIYYIYGMINYYQYKEPYVYFDRNILNFIKKTF